MQKAKNHLSHTLDLDHEDGSEVIQHPIALPGDKSQIRPQPLVATPV
jgi:hypothetical protein